jgi:hypothetical protein
MLSFVRCGGSRRRGLLDRERIWVSFLGLKKGRDDGVSGEDC